MWKRVEQLFIINFLFHKLVSYVWMLDWVSCVSKYLCDSFVCDHYEKYRKRLWKRRLMRSPSNCGELTWRWAHQLRLRLIVSNSLWLFPVLNHGDVHVCNAGCEFSVYSVQLALDSLDRTFMPNIICTIQKTYVC